MKTKATKQPKLTKLELKIKKLNAAYKKATPAQRRVMIAKDALEQINLGKINPTTGTYVDMLGGNIGYDAPLQKVLHQANDVSCDCCAKGALFISCVRLSNRYNGPPADLGSGTINRLLKWPDNNYHLIEAVFEECYAGSGDGSLSTNDKWVEKWNAEYQDAEERLKAILNNIIRNKGTFKIRDL